MASELTTEAEMYQMMERYKSPEESNQMLSQTVLSMNQPMQAFFQMQQASGSGSQHVVPVRPQHYEENEDEDEEYDLYD